VAHSDRLSLDDARHLLRRFAFAATPSLAQSLTQLDAAAAFEKVWELSATAPMTLPALSTDSQPAQLQPARSQSAQSQSVPLQPARSLPTLSSDPSAQPSSLPAQPAPLAQPSIAAVRQQWLAHMATGPDALRENLLVFFHDLFGSSTTSVKNALAHADRNVALRRTVMTTVPGVLEEMILNPAMMMQIGMHGHTVDRVSDRPAKLVLDQWTMGAGSYPDALVEEVSRALTGWSVQRADISTADPLALERGPLVASFRAADFDSEPKTLPGSTANFDARTSMRALALHPATAKRISQRLLRHFGVVDDRQVLQGRLERLYSETQGSMHALLAEIATSDAFWAATSRWQLIKSPVHLAIGACRQLGLRSIPLDGLDIWLSRCGQTLFDTPNNGEGGWANQEAWITPSDRLALRYGLHDVLQGGSFSLGFVASPPIRNERAKPSAPAPESAASAIALLDPAPGIDVRSLRDPQRALARVMATPQYQLA
jgi:uncharacterized protein (DUF1800 family)